VPGWAAPSPAPWSAPVRTPAPHPEPAHLDWPDHVWPTPPWRTPAGARDPDWTGLRPPSVASALRPPAPGSDR
jgi:hypothetical protein